MMAELLAHVLAKAVVETLAPRPRLHLASRDADLSPAQDEDGLPLPMVPGNAATPTTLCAIEVCRGCCCCCCLGVGCPVCQQGSCEARVSIQAAWEASMLCPEPNAKLSGRAVPDQSGRAKPSVANCAVYVTSCYAVFCRAVPRRAKLSCWHQIYRRTSRMWSAGTQATSATSRRRRMEGILWSKSGAGLPASQVGGTHVLACR